MSACSLQSPVRRTAPLYALLCAALASVLLASAVADAGVSRDNGTVRITHNNRPVLTYLSRPNPYKCYVRRLYTPDGRNVLLDSPDDHKHHHGLMYAVQVGDVNFWHEFKDRSPGTQAHESLETLRGGGAGFQHLLNWQSADGRNVARENRTVRLLQPGSAEEPRLLEWRTRLVPTAEDGTATLTGHHYYGLGLRFVRDMDDNVEFSNASGEPGEIFRGAERLVEADWCACTGTIDGEPVTIAMFGDPDNPRHPATWFTMPKPFAYLSATLNLHNEKLEITRDEPLDVHYGIALWDRRVDRARIKDVCRTWLNAHDDGNDE